MEGVLRPVRHFQSSLKLSSQTFICLDLSSGSTYIPLLAGLGQSLDAMAVVPVASALLGPVVGLAAAKAVTSHFSVMVRGLSQVSTILTLVKSTNVVNNLIISSSQPDRP